MTTYTKLETALTYGFSLLPEIIPIMGNDFNRATVLSTMTADIAERFTDISATHAKLLPYLPADTKRDPSYYTYYYLQLASGQKTIISSSWINWATVTEINSKRLVVTIDETRGLPDIDVVKAMLTANGFNKFNVEIG